MHARRLAAVPLGNSNNSNFPEWARAGRSLKGAVVGGRGDSSQLKGRKKKAEHISCFIYFKLHKHYIDVILEYWFVFLISPLHPCDHDLLYSISSELRITSNEPKCGKQKARTCHLEPVQKELRN